MPRWPASTAIRVVLDRQSGPRMADMRNDTGVLQFSPDGRRFACREHTDDLRVRWVVDGAAQQWATDPGADVQPDSMCSALRQYGGDLASHPDVPFAVSRTAPMWRGWGCFGGSGALSSTTGPGYSRPFTWSVGADGQATWFLQREDVLYRVAAVP